VTNGVLAVCKPPGMTSHDVVSFVRRVTGERRTGHAGTLDPAAAGLLLVLVGPSAVRLSDYLLELPKTYVAEVRFGQATDTQDYTGRVVWEAPPGAVAGLSRRAVEEALKAFSGETMQLPPMVSAVRVGGERLYRLAREGRTAERRPRRVFIHRLSLLDMDESGAPGGPPRARLRVTCSKGTYIRTLAEDLGRTLGVGAHLGFLVREAVGFFNLAAARTLEEVADEAGRGELRLLPPADAVAHLPKVVPPVETITRLGHGQAVPLRGDPPRPVPEGSVVRVLDAAGELVATARLSGGRLEPLKVFRPSGGPRR
jgi:tRNA pseudouridine55 synthase